MLIALLSLTILLTAALGTPSVAAGAVQDARHGAGRSSSDAPHLPSRCVSNPDDLLPETAMKCDVTKHIDGAPTIVLWGDSHAWQLIPALKEAIGSRKVNLVGFMMGSCPAMRYAFDSTQERHRTKGCRKVGTLAVRYLERSQHKHRVVRVIFANNWELYHNATTPQDATDEEFHGFITPYNTQTGEWAETATPRAFRAVGRMHIPADVVGPMPMVYENAPDCPEGEEPYLCPLPRRGALVDEQINLDHIADLRADLTEPGRLIEPADYICSASTCLGVKDGDPTYLDDRHIAATMSKRLGKPYFKQSIDDLLAQ